jgi:hypothetical protein
MVNKFYVLVSATVYFGNVISTAASEFNAASTPGAYREIENSCYQCLCPSKIEDSNGDL